MSTSKKKPVIRQGDKAAFVRSLPFSTPASEVRDLAKKKGMIISKAYIHNIRSAANKASRVVMKKAGKKTLKGKRSTLENKFKELVVTLGPARAKKLLTQTETALSLEAQR